MPLAEQTDVEAVLLRALTAAEETYIERILEMASAVVTLEIGQTFEEDTETVTLQPDAYGVIRLPQTPVTAVTSVVVDGQTVDSTGYEWTRQGVMRRQTLNSWEIHGSLLAWCRPVTVTYTHGYDTIPAAVAMVTAELAAGRITSVATAASGAIKTAEVDDIRVEYDTSTTAADLSFTLTEAQIRVLAPYKVPVPAISMGHR